MSNDENFFFNKTVMITGGTGSIGSEVLRRLTLLNTKEIIVFSRDEYKQHQLKFKHADIKNIKYIIGDIRDKESLISASKGVDILFHCAALKHVPISEEMPEEFIKTNILGAINVQKAALENKIPSVVSISTDKVVNPSNVMGMTKAIQEKVFAAHSIDNDNSTQKFVSVRFGNVIGTHGSLFPIFYHQILNDIPVTVTESDMTRFFMSPDEAVDLIFWAAKSGRDGEIIIRKMKSVKIVDVLDYFLKELKKGEDYPIKRIGIRPGEKKHEHLITAEELFRYREQGDYIIVSHYREKDLEKNTLTLSQTSKKLDLNEFYSDNQQNYMTKSELKAYIDNYIKKANGAANYI